MNISQHQPLWMLGEMAMFLRCARGVAVAIHIAPTVACVQRYAQLNITMMEQ